MTEARIVYQTARHWVIPVRTGHEVYRFDGVAGVRVARIGWPGTMKGLARAIAECDKREAAAGPIAPAMDRH